MERRHFEQPPTVDQGLDGHAKLLRQEAHAVSSGAERDRLIRRARQIDIAAHIDEWLSSPGLQPPR
jgi:hypothetical protein